MKVFPAAVMSLLMITSANAQVRQTADTDKNSLVITRSGARPAYPGPAENFTGSVRITPMFDAVAPSRVYAGSVTFEAGARTAWHTHPLGQTLVVTSGTGQVQRWGGPIEQIRQGDVVQIPAGVKHWHGASPDAAMTHTAIHEHLDGKVVHWLEKVSDAQYSGRETTGATTVATEVPAAQSPYVDIAPALGEYTDNVLFGDVWKRPGLSPRDRSLITLATLIAMYRTNELPFHLAKARENGISKDEIGEIITHLAFYAGWPSANTAVIVTRKVFEQAE